MRGSVGVIANATAAREAPGVSEATRLRMSQIVQRGLTSLNALLTDLTSLARLEAGQEKREVATFDAAAAIGDLCGQRRIRGRRPAGSFSSPKARDHCR